jgi:outer membrane receptor protein involved in Fe transport
MRLKFLFSVLVLLSISIGIGIAAEVPNGRIAGVVIDASSKEPLSGATLYVEELKKTILTDEKGEYAVLDVPIGTYTITVNYVGYTSKTQKIQASVETDKKGIIRLTAQSQSLKEVIVTAKNEARRIREQAMPVTVISMKQLQGTVSNVQDILSKTVGVTVHATGGEGSSSRISVRGLEGKRIGIFMDETPMNDQSDYVDINDIPTDMIDRIEIYKGIVPAKFGGSAMGGAVNIVLKEYPDHYADISYSHESFNVNKAQTVFKRHLKDAGLVFGVGGSYTYADNDYTMESPYVKGLKIKRDHDKFKKIIFGGSLKARKWWFDKVELEPLFLTTYKETQGIEFDIRQAHTTSRLFGLNNKLEKENFLIDGLDLDMSSALGYTQYSLIDTAMVWYDWNGNSYPSASANGGELGTRYASNSDNEKLTFINKLNLEYLINKHHSVNFNSVFSFANGYPSDPTKEKSMGKKVDFNSHMKSWVVGFTYDYRTANDRFLNSLTSRYYWYSMKTRYQNIYTRTPPVDIDLTKKSLGFSDAMRYRFTPYFMVKLSGGYDVRIPSENELLGDGYIISPSERLMPERNMSTNLGFFYDLTGIHPSNLQIELNGYYMYLKDMIRYAKGVLGAQYQNFGEMRTLGVELEVKADVFPFLYAYGNVTYQDLRDEREFEENSTIPNPTKGMRMPNIPYFMANAGVEFHKENLFGGRGQNTRLFADLSFIDEYFYDFEITENEKRRIPRSTTLDLSFEHSFMNQRLFISGKVKNVTDAKVLSEFNCPLPGRSFGVKLRYIFK